MFTILSWLSVQSILFAHCKINVVISCSSMRFFFNKIFLLCRIVKVVKLVLWSERLICWSTVLLLCVVLDYLWLSEILISGGKYISNSIFDFLVFNCLSWLCMLFAFVFSLFLVSSCVNTHARTPMHVHTLELIMNCGFKFP